MNEHEASVHSDPQIVKTVQESPTKISLDNNDTKISPEIVLSVHSSAGSEKSTQSVVTTSETLSLSKSNRSSTLPVTIDKDEEVASLETAKNTSTGKDAEQQFDESTSQLEQEKEIHEPHEIETEVLANMKEEDTESYKDNSMQLKDSETSPFIQDSWIDDLKFPETDEEIERAKNLFSMVMDSERIKLMKFSSMLISGFGLRNYPSLCRALEYQYKLDQEYKQRKQKEDEEDLERLKKYRELERQNRGEYRGESGTTYSNLGSQTDFSTMSTSTHQSTTAEHRRRIEYLMGLHKSDGGWEEDAGMSSTVSTISELKDDDLKSCDPEKEEPLTGSSDSMRQAQQYLRTHHIFEFFQFLIVHLLSKVPENPIELLLLLLDKVLIYRSGLGAAPLHYKKRHLEQLFYLMDRMRSGFIDLQQYRTGMNTIGIKCFNSRPPLNADGQVPKEFFLEEAFQCSCHVLNNIIRVRKTVRSLMNGYNPTGASKKGRQN